MKWCAYCDEKATGTLYEYYQGRDPNWVLGAPPYQSKMLLSFAVCIECGKRQSYRGLYVPNAEETLTKGLRH